MKAKTVGSDQVLGAVLNDPTTLSQEASVPAVGSGSAFASLFGLLTHAIPKLKNAAGTYDEQLAAPGATGIPSVDTEGVRATFFSGVIGFVPVATPTDFVGIIGSATKTIRVRRIAIYGFANAAISEDVQLIKRTTANTGSTPVDVTPAIADSNDSATDPGVFRTYTTTNPTLGSSGGLVRAGKLNLGVTGAAGVLEFRFAERGSKSLVLRGVAQAAMLNWNGAAVPAGTSLTIEVEWTAE